MTNLRHAAWIAALLSATWTASAEPTATRDLTSLSGRWTPAPWASAATAVKPVDDAPRHRPGTAGLEIAADYSGQGLQRTGVDFARGTVPGQCRTVRVWVQVDRPDYTWTLRFRDAKGRLEVDGKPLEIALNTEPGQWVGTELTIPESWAQPVTLLGIGGSNWNQRTSKGRATIRLNGLEVTTDLPADPASAAPASLTTPGGKTVFAAGEPIRGSLAVDRWAPTPATARLTMRIVDPAGIVQAEQEQNWTVDGTAARSIEAQPLQYGIYEIQAELTWPDAKPIRRTRRVAYVPARPANAQPERSPWGLTLHSGLKPVDYEQVARLGVGWVRDLAWSRPWMLAARDDRGSYTAGPNYPAIAASAKQAGLQLVPVLGGSISGPVLAGQDRPTPQWRDDLVALMRAFPTAAAWQIDNEADTVLDGHTRDADGAALAAYQGAFAEAARTARAAAIASASGDLRPGSKADASLRTVAANASFGANPPEQTAVLGQSENDAPEMLADRLSAWARGDENADRSAWLTAFGWDSSDGVTPDQQAAYLQRGYLMALAGGVDRAFWCWLQDAPETDDDFLDGAGLFDADGQPKPAAAALAAMTALLPSPEIVGQFDLGPQTAGYLLRDGDRLVACVFGLSETPTDPIALPAGTPMDMYGNALPTRPLPLGPAPIWIDNVPAGDPIVAATGYSLAGPQIVQAAAGQEITLGLQVLGLDAAERDGEWIVEAPSDWGVGTETRTFTVAAGKDTIVPVPLKISADDDQGMQFVRVEVREGGKRVRTFERAFHVRPAPAEPVAVEPSHAGPADAQTAAAQPDATQTVVDATPASSPVAQPEPVAATKTPASVEPTVELVSTQASDTTAAIAPIPAVPMEPTDTPRDDDASLANAWALPAATQPTATSTKPTATVALDRTDTSDATQVALAPPHAGTNPAAANRAKPAATTPRNPARPALTATTARTPTTRPAEPERRILRIRPATAPPSVRVTRPTIRIVRPTEPSQEP